MATGMPDTHYQQWMTRARVHVDAGRALDAMLCFRRASRSEPAAGAPQYGIGELLWKLGRPQEALMAWRRATTRAPRYNAAWQAQADGALFLGDIAAAQAAAARSLALTAGDVRMQLIAALTAAKPDLAAVAAAVAHSPMFLAEPHVARQVAALLRAYPDAAARPALVDTLLPLIQAGTARDAGLLAELGASVPAEVVGLACAAPVAAHEVDGLRLLALALRTHGDGRAPLALSVAQAYADRCTAALAGGIPLLWPLRTGEPRLRALVLTDGLDDVRLRETLALLRPAVEPRDLAVLAAVAAPEHADAQTRAAAANTRLRALLDASAFADSMLAQLSPYPDSASAQVIALRDADVLVDLAGLTVATGPLLALRPARLVLDAAALPQCAPLVAMHVRVDAPDGEARGGDASPLLSAVVTALAAQVQSEPARATTAALAAGVDAAIEANRNQDSASARVGYDAILAAQPAHAPTLYLRGTLLRGLGDSDGAAADFAAAVAAAPADTRSLAALIELELKRCALDRAQLLATNGLAAHPDDVGLLRAAGHVALEQRDAIAALRAFTRAVSADPLNAETHYNHGVALQMLQHPAEAAAAYERALAIAPDMLEARFNLGIVLHAQDDIDGAVRALERVIAHNPRRADAHRVLLNILGMSARHAQWLAALRRFELQCPDALGLVGSALEYYQYQGDFATVRRYLERLDREEFKPTDELDLVDSLEQLLYLLLFFDAEPGMLAALYRTYDRAAQRVYGRPMALAPERTPGRLRIGYLSADLHDHVMGRMMQPALAAHDRMQFAIHLYSTAPATQDDAITEQFARHADGFVHLATLADGAAAARIAADDLDLLVDLSTHTAGARPGILARKPARVQLTHVASAGALGLSAIDYKLTDHWADRAENAAEFIEQLLPMAGCVYPARPMAAAVDHPFTRATLAIDADDIVIGAFVTPLKLSRRTLALWKDILTQLPRARLTFSPNAPWLRDAYPRLLAGAGIDASRMLFLPQGRDEAERLARYDIVDFVLDPMPFGNVNGTLEPLNRGVPVVTLCGQAHGERTGYSLLSNLGVTSTIAQSGREYVAIAVRLGSDPAFMHATREAIVARMATSPLTDMPAYARALEAAYLRALRNHHAGGRLAWNGDDVAADT